LQQAREMEHAQIARRGPRFGRDDNDWSFPAHPRRWAVTVTGQPSIATIRQEGYYGRQIRELIYRMLPAEIDGPLREANFARKTERVRPVIPVVILVQINERRRWREV
jgi:hypothetical protein